MYLWIVSIITLIAGAGVGFAAQVWWQQKKKRSMRQLPRNSAIGLRPIVNSRERRVWRWLSRLFGDHYVMVKVPVTRFTIPTAEEERALWFDLLSDVYCTFTVVDTGGKVVGCVDVAGPGGLPRANLQVKRYVFGRCNIAHWVVDSEQLPRDQDIFNAFIPAVAESELSDPNAGISLDVIQRAHADLKAAVIRSRKIKEENPASISIAATEPSVEPPLASDWAPDSFNGPLDSRAADLPRF